MSLKYTFRLESTDNRRPLAGKLTIVQHELETPADVLLRLMAYLLFYRERLYFDTRLPDDIVPYVPHLASLDYEMRVRLWVECGDCPVEKLHRLAAKVPDAEIWVVKKSAEEANQLLAAMDKHKLRRQRYDLIGLDAEMFAELQQHLRNSNEIFWSRGGFDPTLMQFDFNGWWFDAPFTVLKH